MILKKNWWSLALIIGAIVCFSACEDVVKLTISAPVELEGAQVLIDGVEWGRLERRGKTSELRTRVRPNWGMNIVILKDGYKPIRRTSDSRGPGREKLRIQPNEVVHID